MESVILRVHNTLTAQGFDWSRRLGHSSTHPCAPQCVGVWG